MWDTVAWNYRFRRRNPTFTLLKTKIVVVGGQVLVDNGKKVIEVLDGEKIIGRVKVIVSRRENVIFFIAGRVRGERITVYTAGVSCRDQLVTTQMVQAATDWAGGQVTVSPDPPDSFDEDNIPRLIEEEELPSEDELPRSEQTWYLRSNLTQSIGLSFDRRE